MTLSVGRLVRPYVGRSTLWKFVDLQLRAYITNLDWPCWPWGDLGLTLGWSWVDLGLTLGWPWGDLGVDIDCDCDLMLRADLDWPSWPQTNLWLTLSWPKVDLMLTLGWPWDDLGLCIWCFGLTLMDLADFRFTFGWLWLTFEWP